MTSINPAWENLPHNTEGTRDVARGRLTEVYEADPFIRMLSPDIRGCMIEGFLAVLAAHRMHKVEDALSLYNHKSIDQDLSRAMKAMPLGFLTDGFTKHLTTLTRFALMPHPERDEHHMPV